MRITKRSKKICCLFIAMTMLMTVTDFGMIARATDLTVEDSDVITQESENDEFLSNEVQETQSFEVNVPESSQEEPVQYEEDTGALLETVDVSSADELEEALTLGAASIRITGDFELDRTFYITKDTTIYSESAVTLTRNADFGGDIFVVGESEDGTICESVANFTFGNPESIEENLLVIDGNFENMAETVSGTVLFVCGNAQADIYSNITITNCSKTDNDRVLDAKYNLPYISRIGGAAVILASGSMNIYGSTFSDNTTNDETSSEDDGMICTQGGAVYSMGVLNIYGATFENNHAARGGAVYNYGETHAYNAKFVRNSASHRGGAVYMPSTSSCLLFLGEENEITESSVLFDSNTSEDRGGAIYAQGTLNVNNTRFTNNASNGGHGGAIVASGKLEDVNKTLTVANSRFENNSSYYNGGAVYLTGTEAYFCDTEFVSNTALATANENGTRYGGGALYSTGSVSELDSVTFTSNSSDFYAGAIALYSSSSIVMTNVTAESNTANGMGGAVYINSSQAEINDGIFSQNEAMGGGGALYATGATLNVNGTEFSGNTAKTTGGAVSLHSSTTATMTDVTVSNNECGTTGGGIYINGSGLEMYNVAVLYNTSGANGGAFYSTGSTVEMDGAQFVGNTAGSNGGAVAIHTSTDLIMNNITATENEAVGKGGFLFNNNSALTIYNSNISNCYSKSHGGAVALEGTSVNNIYATTFEGNSCGDENTLARGGAVYVMTDGTKTLTHSCTFIGNKSTEFGGAVYVANGSELVMYDTVAKNNSSPKGGMLYETVIGTVVTLNGVTVSGNTASEGGPIIWGNTFNATLNINKNNFTDLDVQGELDDEYWAGAIVNKLTVYDVDFAVPGYKDYGEEGEDEEENSVIVVAITSAEQLEKAIALGYTNFRIDADFEIDRTIYITDNTHIFADEAHTLTRSVDFAGDMFVIGEDSKGNILEESVVLTIGKKDSKTNNVLTIDGNSANMTAAVSGTVLFVCGQAQADLYSDVTIKNCKKTANTRTLDKKYGLSYTNRIGGAALILASGTVNIYGSIFENNTVNDETNTDAETEEEKEAGMISTQGGAIYSFGALNIYDGKFINNHAAKGGAIYNYRETHIYNGEFKQNNVSDRGGAIYMANSIHCKVQLGESLSGVGSKVTFDGNTAGYRGGAVYVQGVFKANNTEFKNNVAVGAGGAIAAYGHEKITDEKTVTVTNSLFDKNESSGGGAVVLYELATSLFNSVTFTNNKSSTTGGAFVANDSDVKIYNSTFTGNEASSNGGAFMASASNAYLSNVIFRENKATGNGGGLYSTASTVEIDIAEFTDNSAQNYGGAISMHRATATQIASNLILNKITASDNSATNAGGFLYNNHSLLSLYNSEINNNTSVLGGAVSVNGDAESNLYGSCFTGNSCVVEAANGYGGAVYVNTNNKTTLIHSCTFDGNSSNYFGGVVYIGQTGSILNMYNNVAKNNTAPKGAVVYATKTGTVVTISGMTVSGNTVTDGGPIVWGNTVKAKLRINKNNFKDLDAEGALDSAYWSNAIANNITIEEISGDIPRYQDYNNELYDEYAEVTDVATAAELEDAINSGVKNIRIVESFEVDRTFYITGETVIFTTASKTLKRAENFAGDMFVIGEDAAGNSSITAGVTAKLTLGNQYSETPDLLIIDGNSENMTVDVVGTALFLAESGLIDLHKNVSIINNRKVGNKKILNEKYLINNANRVGGAAIIVSDGTVNVYGAKFKNNVCNPENTAEGAAESERDSSLGGAVYNKGTFNIHSGLFEGNESARGGFIYNNRALRIHSGQFVGNHATTYGGAIYLAGSQFSQLYAGNAENAGMSETILFKDNSSDSNAGAIYCASMAIAVMYGDITFDGNKTLNGNGAAICSYGMINADNVVFKNNQAYSMGGALYVANSNEDMTTRIVTVKNSVFDNNIARNGGAVAVYAANDELSEGGIAEIQNCDFTNNKAVNTKDTPVTSNVFGGAVYITRKGSLTITDSDFEGNEALFEGGAIYCAGESITNISNSTFTKNKTVDESDAKGGAVSIHSAIVNFDGVSFTENFTCKNGGAVYVSYTTASSVNSHVILENSSFVQNSVGNCGGAIYATKHKVETEEDEIIKIYNTTFDKNNAVFGGGVYLTSYADAYMKDVAFTNNTASSETENTYGGAMCLAISAEAEIDGAEFIGNNASYSAGAISLNTSARATMNNITARSNSASVSAGFLYVNNARLDMYNSEITSNTAGVNGGAIALYNAAVSNVNNTLFDGNIAGGNGGAIYDYTSETEATLNTCTFNNNKSSNFGGAVYVSNGAILDAYNVVAQNNEAYRGGVMYETTTNTTVTINGMTVNGNKALDAGPVIYGNTVKAILNIHKLNYTDEERDDTADDLYWDYAIENYLTVNDISGTDAEIPPCDTYVPRTEDEEEEKEKPVVPVTDVLSLGQNSSDESISAAYDKLPKLDNSSNFMSRGVTKFDNINGETVTVDSFISHAGEPANNVSVGAGLMIYQAILYKQAHPEEKVNISMASFRFSSLAAVNINRNSRYFGYMRNLPGKDYDKYGFVRISYLLVTAAKMGIDVTVVGQLDGYPHPASEPTFDEYMESFMDYPCDPAYVTDGKVKDYLNFQRCDWTSYDNKAASDMMHTKMCAVSHYLDMNGVAHKNAVWSSSTNLDGINSNATNGNNKMQTATIVSDHEQIYRSTHNYIEIVSQYCGQEDVYIFRTVVGDMSKNQIDLIEAGRADEIAPDEQIVYLGTENDDVFELYFAPFGGDVVSWTESYNPYCKYIRKFNNSDDYVTLIWNSANYDKSTPIVLQLEDMIHRTFLDKKNPQNAIYTNLEDFDISLYKELVVGQDIGYMSLNKLELGYLHSKDLQLSYSENGKREYVSILSSINMHGGAMSYQSNFVLVVKEDSGDEGSVYFTIADQTSTGMVEHTYGEEKTFIPETEDDGHIYKECIYCDKTIIIDTVHRPSDWIVAKKATVLENGISYKKCKGCQQILETKEVVGVETDVADSEPNYFTSDVLESVQISGVPYTFEAVVNVPNNVNDRAGVIVGNYKRDTDNIVSFEIYTDGRPRLYYKVDGKTENCIFNTDIRSNKQKHIAITVNELVATLYVDGKAVETRTLALSLPDSVESLQLGGDNRDKNTQYFKGTIYSVALFADARTAEEVMQDSVLIKSDAESLLYINNFAADTAEEETQLYASVKPAGDTFTVSKYHTIETLEATPHTFEATVHVPLEMSGRAGVVVGNFVGGNSDQLVIEIYDSGRPRIVFRNNGQSVDCIFSTDVRSDGFKHIAITINDTTAKLYVDGELKETKTLNATLPVSVSEYKIGGDNRYGNAQYFKGEIHSVALFSDVREASEIKTDAVLVTRDSENLLYSGYYNSDTSEFVSISGRDFSETEVKGINDISTTPYTFEAILNVPENIDGRGGVIVGNYEVNSKNLVNLEVFNEGRIRLYWRDGFKIYNHVFDTDIRSDKLEHITLTVDGRQATLYVNGEIAETATLPGLLPKLSKDYKIGGDNRTGNTQYFKGTIYGIALYSDVRTAQEVKENFMVEDENLMYKQYFTTLKKVSSSDTVNGKTFYPVVNSQIPLEVDAMPLTFEAVVNMPKDIDDRGGVIVGNYAAARKNSISFEIYSQGRVRLYHKAGAKVESCVFDTDIRSDKMEHIAITVNEREVTLYVNGEAVETKTMKYLMPDAKDALKIGGDNRIGNTQYFKGTIGSITIFGDVRSAEEIRMDVAGVSHGEDNLLCNMNFVEGVCAGSTVGGGHIIGDWIVVREPSETQCGLKHKQCIVCKTVLIVNEYMNSISEGDHVDYTQPNTGFELSSHNDAYSIEKTFDSTPLTYEAFIKIPTTYNDRAGVLIGNYENSNVDQVNIEIYNNGKPRLYYKTNRVSSTYLFNTDVRSDSITHIAITVNGSVATLYVNGENKETVALAKPFANATSKYLIGSDHRLVNPPWFKGEIYSVALFSDVRTDEEIKLDAIMVPRDTEDLVFLKHFAQ